VRSLGHEWGLVLARANPAIIALALAIASAQAKPPGIGRDPARSAWVKSQTNEYGVSCCGEGDGRLVDSRVVVTPNAEGYQWQIKVYRTPDGHGWLFGIPAEAQILVDSADVEIDDDSPDAGWIDVPHTLETDKSSFTGKAFAWWSIAYNRVECFRKPAGY
jgi:hypothetical protein